MREVTDKAMLIIQEFTNALKNNVEHYEFGTRKPLNTVEDIIKSLLKDGKIEIKFPNNNRW